MHKLVIIAAALALPLAACDWGADDEVVEKVCKNKSQVACEQDPRCTWKLPDPDEPEATAKCKERE